MVILHFTHGAKRSGRLPQNSHKANYLRILPLFLLPKSNLHFVQNMGQQCAQEGGPLPRPGTMNLIVLNKGNPISIVQ